MSFTAIRWALSQDSLEDPREALLLVVLADYHNDKTGQCNPSRDTLKKRARIGNNNTLTAKLSTLQKKGLITVYSQNGKSNCYRLKLESTLETESPPSSELNQVQNCTRFRTEPPPSSELNHLPSSELNHEPINEPIKEPNTLSKEREDKNFSLTPTEKKVSKKQTAAKKEKKGPYPYSENDPIPDEFLKIAQANNIQNPQELFKKMVLWCQANGRPYKNWKAGFTTWCMREVGYQKEKEQKKQTQASKQNQFSYEPPGGFTDDYYRDQCEFDENGNLKL
nr:MAG TPA: helix-turn-helix domain protein [Bacteriophage sp.]